MGTLHNTSERKKSDYSHRQRRTRDTRREVGAPVEKILALASHFVATRSERGRMLRIPKERISLKQQACQRRVNLRATTTTGTVCNQPHVRFLGIPMVRFTYVLPLMVYIMSDRTVKGFITCGHILH